MKIITVTTSNPSSPVTSTTTAHIEEAEAYEALREQHLGGYLDTEGVPDEDLIDLAQSYGIAVDMAEHILNRSDVG